MQVSACMSRRMICKSLLACQLFNVTPTVGTGQDLRQAGGSRSAQGRRAENCVRGSRGGPRLGGVPVVTEGRSPCYHEPIDWRSLEGTETVQGTATYREQSRTFLEQAFVELEAGDLHQASEKGWGAAAQMLKAVAAERGWEHGTHRMLFSIVGRLASETQNEELRDLFDSAGALHANFYEGWLDADWVTSGLNRVQVFVDAAEALLTDP